MGNGKYTNNYESETLIEETGNPLLNMHVFSIISGLIIAQYFHPGGSITTMIRA